MNAATPLSGGPAPLAHDRRAAVAMMAGILAPVLVGCAALVVDTGFWVVAQTRLQIAADAGAMGAARLLTVTALKTANNQTYFKPVALAEAQGAAATRLVGTFDPVLGITATVPADWSKVTVVMTSTGNTYFAKIFGVNAGPTLKATAVVSVKQTAPCLLMLGTTGIGIQVDNMGVVQSTGCPLGSNSVSNPSIYLNSGTISAPAIDTPGTLAQSNSGSNTLSPTTATAMTSLNPEAAVPIPPAPSGCDSTNTTDSSGGVNYKLSTNHNPKQYVFCGNTVLGGNGSTFSFKDGTYYVVNGDLTFNNVDLVAGSNISFVMLTTPGYTGTSNFSWTNYSNNPSVITGAVDGPTAGTGISLWQLCAPNGPQPQTASFQGGSSLSVTGAIYMPCSAVDIGNNAKIAGPPGAPFSFIAKSAYVHGSASLKTVGSGSAGISTNPLALTQ